MSKPYAVVFAGVPASSKKAIAHYLSCKFGLPILSHDTIRNEVKEDLLISDINDPQALQEYEKRVSSRRSEVLESSKPIIFACSVDRRWAELKQQLTEKGYGWFLISLDLSKPFVEKLFAAKGYQTDYLDNYLKQHEDFLQNYRADVSLSITDENFAQRLALAADGLQKFIENIGG